MDHVPHVLLVEDNQDDVELALHAFGTSSLEPRIVVCRDGEEALRYLIPSDGTSGGEDGVLPALVLLDLKLPGMNGIEVLRRLRADTRTKRVPVVILTTSDDRSDVIGGYDSGVNSYIRKPVEFNEFTTMVRQLEHYWLLTNIAPPS